MITHNLLFRLTDARNHTDSLERTANSNQSEIWQGLSPRMRKVVQREHVTSHFHKYGIERKHFEDGNLTEMFMVTGMGVDRNGVKFVSMYEGKQGLKYELG